MCFSVFTFSARGPLISAQCLFKLHQLLSDEPDRVIKTARKLETLIAPASRGKAGPVQASLALAVVRMIQTAFTEVAKDIRTLVSHMIGMFHFACNVYVVRKSMLHLYLMLYQYSYVPV